MTDQAAGVLVRAMRAASRRARQRRGRLFRETFELTRHTRILDLGSEDGSYMHAILEGTDVRPQNVYIADITRERIERGHRRYGYQPVLIPEAGRLDFPDRYFDIVHCSSVIEHVTVPKSEVWTIRSGELFRARARARQKEFADEIRRLGRQYFVQTPNRYFPLESHSWLPLAGYLPRSALVGLLRVTNHFWIKRTTPDWCLLDEAELAELFADARIVRERVCGMTKSLIAVRAATGQQRAPVRETRRSDSVRSEL